MPKLEFGFPTPPEAAEDAVVVVVIVVVDVLILQGVCGVIGVRGPEEELRGVGGHRRGLLLATAGGVSVSWGGKKVGVAAVLRAMVSEEDAEADEAYADASDEFVPRRTSCLRPATGDMDAKRAAAKDNDDDDDDGDDDDKPGRSGVGGGDVGVEVGDTTEPGSW